MQLAILEEGLSGGEREGDDEENNPTDNDKTEDMEDMKA